MGERFNIQCRGRGFYRHGRQLSHILMLRTAAWVGKCSSSNEACV